ncbi:MAG TPA: sugar ABC transporter permease [Thermotogota bacterium]|nr:sugar ABC transporter permease [Thermotogota bacterium]HNR63536.1 sugar ABC transporter permease [Thermotogota bacterium]HPB86453.1 sugar ABC transporter permease [Thermotogota bacterium]HPH10468.1 sugar ABC transporter permease [Thermotogota bacterium]HPM20680.1 sugar ABC transporter permease [Thermotogota bacterium]
MTLSKKHWWKPWAFLALPLTMYVLWVIWPIIQTFGTSFTKWDGMDAHPIWIGFDNFTLLFRDATFWTSIRNNLYWMIFFLGIPVPCGLFIALLFDMKLPGGKVYKTLFYLSMTLSFVVIGQIWSWIYQPQYGALTSFVRLFGFNNLGELQQWAFSAFCFVLIPLLAGLFCSKVFFLRRQASAFKTLWVTLLFVAVWIAAAQWLKVYWNPQLTISRIAKRGFPWINDPDFVTFSLIFAAIWRQIPYVMVLFLAGLKNVPPELVEAAVVDGASWGQRFWYVLLPMLKPATIVAMTISIIDSLRAFDIVYSMTRGGPFNSSNVLANFMYIESFHNYRMGYGSAIAVIQFVITFGFIAVYLNNVLRTEANAS